MFHAGLRYPMTENFLIWTKKNAGRDEAFEALKRFCTTCIRLNAGRFIIAGDKTKKARGQETLYNVYISCLALNSSEVMVLGPKNLRATVLDLCSWTYKFNYRNTTLACITHMSINWVVVKTKMKG